MKKFLAAGLATFSIIVNSTLPAINCYECFDPCNMLWSFRADYLYWTAKQNDRDFIRVERGSGHSKLLSVSDDSIKQSNYEWNSGYRVSAGYRPCDCLWSLDLEYTHFQTSGDKHLDLSFPKENDKPKMSPSLPPYAKDSLVWITNASSTDDLITTNAKSHADIKMDLGDVNLLRHSFCNAGAINVNVLIGVRGGRITSHWKNTYFYPNVSILPAEPGPILTGDARHHVEIDWNYLSIGPRFGAEADVGIGCGISFYGNFSGSLVYGKLKKRNVNSLEFPVDEDDNVVNLANINKGQYKLTPIIQGEAGFAYTYYCDRFAVQAKIGFEMQSWINLAENTHYVLPGASRYKDSITDLDLYGLTAGLNIAF